MATDAPPPIVQIDDRCTRLSKRCPKKAAAYRG
jgi:hypothetical protein